MFILMIYLEIWYLIKWCWDLFSAATCYLHDKLCMDIINEEKHLKVFDKLLHMLFKYYMLDQGCYNALSREQLFASFILVSRFVHVLDQAWSGFATGFGSISLRLGLNASVTFNIVLSGGTNVRRFIEGGFGLKPFLRACFSQNRVYTTLCRFDLVFWFLSFKICCSCSSVLPSGAAMVHTSWYCYRLLCFATILWLEITLRLAVFCSRRSVCRFVFVLAIIIITYH